MRGTFLNSRRPISLRHFGGPIMVDATREDIDDTFVFKISKPVQGKHFHGFLEDINIQSPTDCRYKESISEAWIRV